VGRGPGSGHGKTSTRGHKGQKARSGASIRPGFEGGQMPLQRRLPKRGFNNAVFKKEYAIINVSDLNVFENGADITPEVLQEAGMVKKVRDGIKLLGNGELEKKLNIKVHKVSKQAEEKVVARGGKVEVI
jgi:large subunit ribosomal protein L15